MKHLAKYAQWLEAEGADWQHFPARKEDGVLRKFRKHLIDEMKRVVPIWKRPLP